MYVPSVCLPGKIKTNLRNAVAQLNFFRKSIRPDDIKLSYVISWIMQGVSDFELVNMISFDLPAWLHSTGTDVALPSSTLPPRILKDGRPAYSLRSAAKADYTFLPEIGDDRPLTYEDVQMLESGGQGFLFLVFPYVSLVDWKSCITGLHVIVISNEYKT